MDLKQYLSFTRKERKGILSLLIIVLAITFIPRYIFPNRQVIIKVEGKQMEDMINSGARNFSYKSNLRDTAATSRKIHIKNQFVRQTARKKRQFDKVDVNSADTSEFISLPGIGSKLAARIVLFREKLGGFTHVGQIAEVYGLRDSVFIMIRPYLHCDSSVIRKIKINRVEEENLKSHPYVKWKLAAKLINYRTQHGPFDSINDLEKIYLLDSQEIRKIKPYLDFEQ